MIGKKEEGISPYVLGYRAGYKKAKEEFAKGGYDDGYTDAVKYMQSIMTMALAKIDRNRGDKS